MFGAEPKFCHFPLSKLIDLGSKLGNIIGRAKYS